MNKFGWISWAFIPFIAVSLLAAVPQSDSGYLEKGVVRIRIFEGSTEAGAPPVTGITSSFSQSGLTEKGEWDEDPEVQAAGIRKAFNLVNVVFTSADRITWEMGRLSPSTSVLRFPNKADLSLVITPTGVSARKVKIEVFEQNEGTKTNILSTEAGLPKESYTVFGFKDLRGNPYFVALQLGEWDVTPVPSAPVRRLGPKIQPPNLIKKVEPVYPREALDAKIEGNVVLEAQTDIYGRVQSIKILRSVPMLDQAAKDAVRQWVYEPMLIDGKPRGVVFTVTVRFDPRDKPAALEVPSEGPVKAIGPIKPPTLIKQVEPVYPKIAAEARVDGIVILEAMTDITGRVASVKVLRSIPLLDQAAIDAVRQWVYEPMVINGRPREVIFTTTVRFTLDKARSSTATTMQIIPAEGGGTIRILNAVAPTYPEEAKKANVDGTVLLEAAVNEKGLVEDVRVLRAVHPALDTAAVAALKEWKFESAPLPLVGGTSNKRTVILYARYTLSPVEGKSETEIGGVTGGVEGGSGRRSCRRGGRGSGGRSRRWSDQSRPLRQGLPRRRRSAAGPGHGRDSAARTGQAGRSRISRSRPRGPSRWDHHPGSDHGCLWKSEGRENSALDPAPGPGRGRCSQTMGLQAASHRRQAARLRLHRDRPVRPEINKEK